MSVRSPGNETPRKVEISTAQSQPLTSELLVFIIWSHISSLSRSDVGYAVVSYLQNPSVVNNTVAGLQVTMGFNIAVMKECHSLKEMETNDYRKSDCGFC